jgi:hypothetical protein
MRNLLLTFLFLCSYYKVNSQVDYFNRLNDLNFIINTYQDLVIINPDTSIVFGYSRDFNHKRITCAFIDNATGDTLYTFKYGSDTIDIYGGYNDYNCIINDVIYSCGCYYKNGNAYANFMKFSLNGDLILDSLYYIPVSSQYAWTQFNSMLPLDDGSFLLVGSKERNYGNLDLWLVKMDLNGNILWEKSFDSSWYDNAVKIVPHQGNFLISGGKMVSGEVDNWYLCVDSDGNLIWEKSYGGPFYDGGNAISLNNGEIQISGSREYASHRYESLVMRLNNNGDFLWQKSYMKQSFYYHPSSLHLALELQDGSIILEGTTTDNNSFFSQPIGVIMKISESGDSLWSRYYHLRSDDHYTWDLEELDNGDFLMSGYVFPDSQDNTQDGWLMRTNCLGYFEHPKDSLVLNASGSVLTATNNASYFEYTTISWGDGDIDTLYANEIQYIEHQYTIPGMYDVTSTTVACNDTISHHYAHTVTPISFSELDLSVFPNPNDGLFEIWLNSDDLFDIDVLDLNGRIVKQDKNVLLKNGCPLNLMELESAVYFIRARAGNQVYQSRVVIAKTL